MAEKMESQSKYSTPLLITASFMGITWAAVIADKFVEVIDVMERLLAGWRNFFRELWSDFFEWIDLPIPVLDHQKDALTFIGFLAGGAILTSIIGIRGQYLFKNTIVELFNGTTFLGAIELTWKVVFGISLMLLVALPFVNTQAFSHDFSFIVLTFIYIIGGLYAIFIPASLLMFAYSLARGKTSFKYFFIELKHSLKRAVEIIRSTSRSAIAMLIVGVLFGFSIYFLNDSEFIKSIPDPEPFHYFEYLKTLGLSDAVDILLLVLVFLGILLASGRSLRPMVFLLTVGMTILILGMSANSLTEAWERNFGSAEQLDIE